MLSARANIYLEAAAAAAPTATTHTKWSLQKGKINKNGRRVDSVSVDIYLDAKEE